jgi:hypothetical protein
MEKFGTGINILEYEQSTYLSSHVCVFTFTLLLFPPVRTTAASGAASGSLTCPPGRITPRKATSAAAT